METGEDVKGYVTVEGLSLVWAKLRYVDLCALGGKELGVTDVAVLSERMSLSGVVPAFVG